MTYATAPELMALTGHEFEQYVGRVFHENGHHAAVTPGSGDYGVDLVLNGYIAVQVKLYSTPVGPKAIQEVVAGKAIYNCTDAWVVTNHTFTSAAEALGKANGVRLIAGKELQWLAENPDQTADHRERYEAAQAAARAAERAERLAEREARRARRQAEQEAHGAKVREDMVREAEERRAEEAARAQAAEERRQAEEAQWKAELSEYIAWRRANARKSLFTGRLVTTASDRFIEWAASKGVKVMPFGGNRDYCTVEIPGDVFTGWTGMVSWPVARDIVNRYVEDPRCMVDWRPWHHGRNHLAPGRPGIEYHSHRGSLRRRLIGANAPLQRPPIGLRDATSFQTSSTGNNREEEH